MKFRNEYQFTYETYDAFDNVIGSDEVCVTYDVSPGRPAYTPRGEFAPIDPPEPPEIEVVGFSVETAPFDGRHWREASDEEHDRYSLYIEGIEDRLIEDAEAARRGE